MSDIVEIVFHLCGEGVTYIFREIVFEERRHDVARVSRNERLLLFGHIAAVDDRLNNRRVSRRAADTAFFKFFDETCFRVARRRLGLLFFGAYFKKPEFFSDSDFRYFDIFAASAGIAQEPAGEHDAGTGN